MLTPRWESRRKVTTVLWQRLRGFENLLRLRDHKKVLSNHTPPNRSRRIYQELTRTRNILAACQLVGVNQIIAGNCLEFWIREKSKSVSGFLDHVLARLLGRVYADPHDPDSRLGKLIQFVLETSQLEVAVPSPVASVKNYQHGFWRLVGNWLNQQLSQRDRLIVRISEGKVGRLLSDLWRSK